MRGGSGLISGDVRGEKAITAPVGAEIAESNQCLPFRGFAVNLESVPACIAVDEKPGRDVPENVADLVASGRANAVPRLFRVGVKIERLRHFQEQRDVDAFAVAEGRCGGIAVAFEVPESDGNLLSVDLSGRLSARNSESCAAIVMRCKRDLAAGCFVGFQRGCHFGAC